MTNSLKFYHLAHEWNVPVLQLLQLARCENIPYELSLEQVDLLKQKINKSFELTNIQVRSLEDVLLSDEAKPFVDEAASVLPLLSDVDQKKYLLEFCRRIYPLIQDQDLREVFSPEAVCETILNLGIVMVPRTGGIKTPTVLPPPHLLKIDEDMAYNVLRRYFLSIMERFPIQTVDDFQSLSIHLQEVSREVKDYATGKH